MKKLIIFLAIFFLFSGCSKKPQPPSPGGVLHPKTTSKKGTIKFGVVARYSPRLIYQGYQPIMDYLTAETDYRFELKLSKTYNEALKFIEYDSVQIAFLGTCTYIEANKKFDARCILKPLNPHGRPFFKGIIIVRDDSPIYSLTDLKGKSFAFASQKATAGFLIPKQALYKAGVKLSDLKKYTNIEHHNSVVNAVLRGEYDAGAVKDIVAYQNKDKGLRFIYISPDIPSVPIVISANADTNMVRQVKQALLKLSPNKPEHQLLVRNWDAEFKYGFTPARDSDYDAIRHLIKWLEAREK